MEELLVIGNPSKGRRKGKKHRTAAQKAATRKMIAANRRRGGHHGGGKRKRKKTHSIALAMGRSSNPRRRRVHHNPVGLGGAIGMVTNALQGAAGAIVVDVAMAKLPIPAQLKAGKIRYLTAGVAALGLGIAAGMVPGVKKFARNMAEGSLVVTLRDAIKEVAAGAGVNLGYYSAAPVFSYPSPAQQNLRGGDSGRNVGRMGRFMPALKGMGEFMPVQDARTREARQMGEVGVYFHR